MQGNTINVKVIVGSVREGRFAREAADWVAGKLAKQEGVLAEVLDLKDYPMPFFDAMVSPSFKQAPYADANVEKWTAKIGEGDAFIMVTPEYNHGTSGVLKNAIDWVGAEWHNKPVGFVSYGSVGGARAVEHLRGTAIELQMASVREAVHFPGNEYFAAAFGDRNFAPMLAKHADKAGVMIGQLLTWARMFKTIR